MSESGIGIISPYLPPYLPCPAVGDLRKASWARQSSRLLADSVSDHRSISALPKNYHQEFEILRNTLWNRGSLRKGANVGSTGRYGIQPDRSIYALSRQSSACSYSCSPT